MVAGALAGVLHACAELIGKHRGHRHAAHAYHDVNRAIGRSQIGGPADDALGRDHLRIALETPGGRQQVGAVNHHRLVVETRRQAVRANVNAQIVAAPITQLGWQLKTEALAALGAESLVHVRARQVGELALDERIAVEQADLERLARAADVENPTGQDALLDLLDLTTDELLQDERFQAVRGWQLGAQIRHRYAQLVCLAVVDGHRQLERELGQLRDAVLPDEFDHQRAHQCAVEHHIDRRLLRLVRSPWLQKGLRPDRAANVAVRNGEFADLELARYDAALPVAEDVVRSRF